MRRTFNRFKLLAWLAVAPVFFAASASYAQVSSGTSQPVTWNCTGTPCPWGSSEGGNAIVWPAAAGATSTRHGYTTTQPIYLPQSLANGAIIQITAGSASAFAGTPSASSHRQLTSISAGGSFTVSGLALGEVLSVQNDYASFSYTITLPTSPPPPPPGTLSEVVSWNCTGTPCPWGNSETGNAAVWTASTGATSTRHGYTTSKAIYLPQGLANGLVVSILSGSASAYAGAPGASSHRQLTTISAGGTYTVSGLAVGEVLSLQNDYAAFSYEFTLPPPPPPAPTGLSSEPVTWVCTGSPCPWGGSENGIALVWPASAGATNSRLGYSVSKDIYLPRNLANGATLTITSGTVTAYAGTPAASSHRAVVTIAAGGTFTFSGLATGEVLSIQSDNAFTYQVSLPTNVPEEPPPPVPGTINSIPAYWRCNLPGCTGEDWFSGVINWPSTAAYSTNARSGNESRTVYDEAGQQLYPYMGSWANGCEITAQSGLVLIIEWQRGKDVWRETWLNPGETHTIHLTPPENGAMIESFDYSPGFSVTLNNCTPGTLP